MRARENDGVVPRQQDSTSASGNVAVLPAVIQNPVEPFRITPADVKNAAASARSYLWHFLTKSLYQMGGYALEVLPTIPAFIGDSLRHKDAPSIYKGTYQIVKNDMVFMLFVGCLSYFLEQQLQPDENSSWATTIAGKALSLPVYFPLLLITFFHWLQFQLHSTLLLMNYSKSFHAMALVFQAESAKKKEDKTLQKMQEDLFLNGNKFDGIKDDLYTSVLFFVQQGVLFLLRNTPYLYLIGTPVSYFWEVYITGQFIFDYPLAAKDINWKYRRINLQQYPELYFTFGLLHQFIMRVVLYSLGYAKELPAILFGNYVRAALFMISTLTLLGMPVFDNREWLLQTLRDKKYLTEKTHAMLSAFDGNKLLPNNFFSYYVTPISLAVALLPAYLSGSYVASALLVMATLTAIALHVMNNKKMMPENWFCHYVHPLFLIPVALELLSVLPSTVCEARVAGLSTLWLVGLSCYFPFPALVEKSTRFSLEPWTYGWFSGVVTRAICTESKELLKEEKKLFDADKKEALKGATFTLSGARKQLAKLTALFSIENPNKGDVVPTQKVQIASSTGPQDGKSVELPSIIAAYDLAAPYYSKAQYVYSGVMGQFFSDWIREKASAVIFPRAFHGRFELMDDPIFQEPLLNFLKSVRVYAEATIFCRETVVYFVEAAKAIDAFFSQRKVKIISWVVGLSLISDLLTKDFIINRSPEYLTDFLTVLEKLKEWGVLSEAVHSDARKKVIKFQKKIKLVREVLNEVPPASVDKYINFLQSDDCLLRLQSMMASAGNFLKEHPLGCALLESDEFDEVGDSDYRKIDPCEFPTREELGFKGRKNKKAAAVSQAAANEKIAFELQTSEAGSFQRQVPEQSLVRFTHQQVMVEKQAVSEIRAARAELPKNNSEFELVGGEPDEFDVNDIPDAKDFAKKYGSDVPANTSFTTRLVGSAHRLSANLVAAVGSSKQFVAGPPTEPSFARPSGLRM